MQMTFFNQRCLVDIIITSHYITMLFFICEPWKYYFYFFKVQINKRCSQTNTDANKKTSGNGKRNSKISFCVYSTELLKEHNGLRCCGLDLQSENKISKKAALVTVPVPAQRLVAHCMIYGIQQLLYAHADFYFSRVYIPEMAVIIIKAIYTCWCI